MPTTLCKPPPYTAGFSIHGLGDTAIDIMDPASLPTFSNSASDIDLNLMGGLEDPYGQLDLGTGFDAYASFVGYGQSSKDYSMSIAVPARPSVAELNRQSLSPPVLSASTGTTSTSPGNSPVVGTTAQQTTGRQPSPNLNASLGISVTSPTGVTMNAGFGFSLPEGYFPPQQADTSASPVLAMPASMPGPAPSASAIVPRSRQNTAAVASGFFPQPAPQFNPFIPSVAQPHPALGAYTIAYKPTIRTPLTDPTRSLSNFQETLVFYYFNRGVRRMQYLLADDSTTGVTDVMYDLVIRDPLG